MDINEVCKNICLNNSIEDYLNKIGTKIIKKGRTIKCLCPIHVEKTPSFNIKKDKNGIDKFRCFGCSSSGNLLNLISKIENRKLWDIIKEYNPNASTILIKYDPAIKNIPVPEEETLSLFCEEERICSKISKYGRSHLELMNGSVDAVDKLSILYKRVDQYLEIGNEEGLEKIYDDLIILMNQYGEYESTRN